MLCCVVLCCDVSQTEAIWNFLYWVVTGIQPLMCSQVDTLFPIVLHASKEAAGKGLLLGICVIFSIKSLQTSMVFESSSK